MNAKSLIGGILAGAAVGVAIGMLLAPESGTNTKKKLAKGARQLGDSLMETAEGSIQTLKDRFNRKVDDVARTSKDGISNANEKFRV